jgi:hypothetical protein
MVGGLEEHPLIGDGKTRRGATRSSDRLVGINEETGQKLLLTVAFVLAILLVRAASVELARVVAGRHRNERVMFWIRQVASVTTAAVTIVALLSIWFDDPQRLTTGLGRC